MLKQLARKNKDVFAYELQQLTGYKGDMGKVAIPMGPHGRLFEKQRTHSALEKEIMDIFSGPLDYAIDGEQVTLTAADGRFLVYQVDHGTDPEPTSSALQGTTWQLEVANPLCGLPT